MSLADFSLSPVALGATAFIFSFYHLSNWALQWGCYSRRPSPSERARWKLQPDRPPSSKTSVLPWLPILEPLGYLKQSPRYPRGWLLATFNTVLASLMAGLTAELIVRGYSRLHWESLKWSAGSTWGRMALELLAAVIWESVVEYYWHRWMVSTLLMTVHCSLDPGITFNLMRHPLPARAPLAPLQHSGWAYKRCHRIHHFNRAPSPFDDMLIHPLEGGWQCRTLLALFALSCRSTCRGRH